MLDTLKKWVGVRCRVWSRTREGVQEWDYWTTLEKVWEVDEGVLCSDGVVTWLVVENGFEVTAEKPIGTWDLAPLAERYRISREYETEENHEAGGDAGRHGGDTEP